MFGTTRQFVRLATPRPPARRVGGHHAGVAGKDAPGPPVLADPRPPPPSSPTGPIPTRVALSTSQTGAIFEIGFGTLLRFMSGGALDLTRPALDDQDVDGILTRPRGRKAAFLQLKSRAAPATRQTLELHFDAIADASGRPDLHLLAGELLGRPPWVGPRFALIPAPKLPRPVRGRINLSIPLRRGSRSKWAAFVHDRLDLASRLSAALDRGPAYPFPVPAERIAGLSLQAIGHLIERGVAAATLYHGAGRLHLWRPLVDDFGQDLAVTDATRAAAMRVQPKGSMGLDAGGRVSAKVHASTFRGRRFDFLVFASYDPSVPGLGSHCFVMRADEFADRVEPRGGYLRFAARPDAEGAGPWAPWLYKTEEVAGVLETALAVRRARGPGALLPACREDVDRERRAARGRGAAP